MSNSLFEKGYYLTNEDLVVVLMGILAQAISSVLKAILLVVHAILTPHTKNMMEQHTILRPLLSFWQHLCTFVFTPVLNSQFTPISRRKTGGRIHVLRFVTKSSNDNHLKYSLILIETLKDFENVVIFLVREVKERQKPIVKCVMT